MTGIVIHFWEIDNLCLKMKSGFWEESNSILKEHRYSWNRLLRETKICKSTLRYNKKTFINIKTLRKIINFLSKIDSNFNFYYIENNRFIEKMKYGKGGFVITEPKIPINLLDIGWAKIIGALLTDGCIQKNGKTYFINKNKLLMDKLIEVACETLGYFQPTVKKKRRMDKEWFVVILPRLIGVILIKFAKIKGGNKVKNNVSIPDFINNLDVNKHRLYLYEFLSWMFSCDGYVSPSNYSIGINFNRDLMDIEQKDWKNASSAPQLLKDTINILRLFNFKINGPYFIEVKQRKDNSYTSKWRFEISGKQSLAIFKNEIGFVLLEKEEKLNSIFEKEAISCLA